MGAYCNWHGKELVNVAEHEQEQCWEQGRKCEDCPYFGEKEDGMGKLSMVETNYKSYHPINGVVEPDFLEYLKETFRKWQQYHEEGQEWFSLMIYKNREEMEVDAQPLYHFTTRIHK